jgi:4-hydroxy-tetrahydrodipicolinate reductase
MIKAGICGISGRMGRTVLNMLLEKGHSIGAAFEKESDPNIGKDAGSVYFRENLNVKINPINENDITNTDGIIDFSTPKATFKLIDMMKELKKPLVCGTTGFADDEMKKIKDASEKMPLLLSPNMSMGINLLFKLTEIASKVLGNDFDTEVFEVHHRFKVDAPSGTAKRLLDIIKLNVPRLKEATLIYDRSRQSKAREDNEIGIHTLRGGDIVGDHTVLFAGFGERIELTHRASSREIFARGAVLALEFLTVKKPGLYNMFDVLGL